MRLWLYVCVLSASLAVAAIPVAKRAAAQAPVTTVWFGEATAASVVVIAPPLASGRRASASPRPSVEAAGAADLRSPEAPIGGALVRSSPRPSVEAAGAADLGSPEAPIGDALVRSSPAPAAGDHGSLAEHEDARVQANMEAPARPGPAPRAASASPSQPTLAAPGGPAQVASGLPACPPPVTVVRRMGGPRERLRMPLMGCDGRPSEEAARALSILARPRGARRADVDDLTGSTRLLDVGLLARLQYLSDVLGGPVIELLSGVRSPGAGPSRHHAGRAIDIRVRGVARDVVRDELRSLADTGVGSHPRDGFIHVDVREGGAHWIDARPGATTQGAAGRAPGSATTARDPTR